MITPVHSCRGLLSSVVDLIEEARRQAARSVNSVITATYWEMGRRIVEHEQQGRRRAGYGEALLNKLSADLTAHFGRGFSRRNLEQMRLFYLNWKIPQTLSAESRPCPPTAAPDAKSQTLSAELVPPTQLPRFPLPWSHYVRLLSVSDLDARSFYETEALRGGWSLRQLDRQISTLYYERTIRSRRSLTTGGPHAGGGNAAVGEQEIKDPLVLEFLGLKNEYSETAVEEALIQHLEHFLLELGNDFAFLAGQKRLRAGDEWYRIDLLFYHRRLRCLIIIDLKLGRFTHADAGQRPSLFESCPGPGESSRLQGKVNSCTASGRACAREHVKFQSPAVLRS